MYSENYYYYNLLIQIDCYKIQIQYINAIYNTQIDFIFKTNYLLTSELVSDCL